MFWTVLSLLCCIYNLLHQVAGEAQNGLQLMTVATEANDGFLRFAQSAERHKYNLKVLGMGQQWEGGDVMRFPGGGQKIQLLREALEPLKDKSDLIILFTDSYDVVLDGSPKDVLKAFRKFDSKIVISAEGFCWPDSSLESTYPTVKLNEKRFLNSGGFIGYAPYIYKLVSQSDVKKADDDQLYYTKIYLDPDMRQRLSIRLDTRSEIFQNLNGALDEVQVKFKGSSSYLYNHRTGNTPLIIHGNGPVKHQFNTLTNYLGDRWTPTAGCQRCEELSISLAGVKPEDYPTVYLAIFIEHPSAFITEFFHHIGELYYPKDRMTLQIHYTDSFHDGDVTTFMDKYGIHYDSVQVFGPDKNYMDEHTARNKAIELCVAKPGLCQYFFSVDSDAQLEDPNVLAELIQRNRSVVAPFLGRPGKTWSNFWGAVNEDGFYKRSDDYMSIMENKYIGLWNVPYITTTYLIHGYLTPKLAGAYTNGNMDADMAICYKMRELGIFMYVDNQKYYGHLVDNDDFSVNYANHLHNDLYQIFDNKYDWEKKYIHPDFWKQLEKDFVVEQPCPDVYWFPLVTPTFCEHIIGEMENLNQWSAGKNEDSRLNGGYENVPTVDTHTNQIGWEKHWLQILHDYIAPLSLKLYEGYYTDARAVMNFVVRYRPTEQDRLRPHQDSSTYTINGALNKVNTDYEGGGVRFTRYNCTNTKLRQGWFLMHPGRLTHHHEGLPTTKGTRYIMVSFIDP